MFRFAFEAKEAYDQVNNGSLMQRLKEYEKNAQKSMGENFGANQFNSDDGKTSVLEAALPTHIQMSGSVPLWELTDARQG